MINQYASKIRRQLHRYPEVGFDLPRTLQLIRDELEADGIEYTERFGKSSIVATINPEKNHYTIGIRADIDALPITEDKDVEYKSCIPGQMHACGHDVHAAIALATIKDLNAMRDQINCCVKVVFQAAEEMLCGARYLVADGVMDDIDCMVALHTAPEFPVGQVAMRGGPHNANSDHMKFQFFGKNAHAANQQRGVDAIMMAVKTYTAMEFAFAKEFDARKPVIFNIGRFNGGTGDNIISDYCELTGTLRTWDDESEQKAFEIFEKVGKSIAEMSGGTYKYTLTSHYPILNNDQDVTDRLWKSAVKAVGEENVKFRKERGMGGEDFAYYAQKKPCSMFRLGVTNEAIGIKPVCHNPNFDVDENCLQIGIDVFKQFVLDNMDNKR